MPIAKLASKSGSLNSPTVTSCDSVLTMDTVRVRRVEKLDGDGARRRSGERERGAMREEEARTRGVAIIEKEGKWKKTKSFLLFILHITKKTARPVAKITK